MPQPPRAITAAGGFFAALIVVFVFGFFVGLPVIVWVLLVAAFVGLWVATAGKRAAERDTEQPRSERPWRDNRDSGK
jgi:type III secretory pathway component EscV